MHPDTLKYNAALAPADRAICNRLATIIDGNLKGAENKVWHAHPVWFLDGNPIVGYSKLKGCIRLMFWSGADFEDEELAPGTGKFKDASRRYTSSDEVDEKSVKRWLRKARKIQWDYKNLMKRGRLVRLGSADER